MQALVSRYPWFSYAREVLLCRLAAIEPDCLESNYKENLIFFPKRDHVLLKCRSIIASSKAHGVQEVDVVQLLDTAPLPPESHDSVVSQPIEEDMVIGGEEDGFEIDFELIQKEAEDFVISNREAIEVSSQSAGEDVVVEKEIVKESKPKVFVVGGDYFSKEDFDALESDERAPEIKFAASSDSGYNSDVSVASDFEVDFESMDFVTETLAAIYADQGYYDKAIDAYAKLILLYPEKSTYFASLVNEIKSKN